ncbi:MAG: hypothetical protein JST85_30635 [Acidobacteria bacterium]|nr:hypothetical protein [Acidobacteriota bacterium]
MNDAYSAIDAAIKEIDSLKRMLKKSSSQQVRSSEECSVIKAVCLTWFRNHRPIVEASIGEDLLKDVDVVYKNILVASDRATLRSRYYQELKVAHSRLSEIRNYTISSPPTTITADTPPSFAPLVSNVEMQEILKRRWSECAKCVEAGAPLAAIVMMGGLLEALLLARVNKATNKPAIFAATKAPKDKTTGKTLPLQEWTLRHYIDVAHELDWISASAKDVGEVVRDYRNYIHPHKELSHGVILNDGDANLFWEIAKSIARQILM